MAIVVALGIRQVQRAMAEERAKEVSNDR